MITCIECARLLLMGVTAKDHEVKRMYVDAYYQHLQTHKTDREQPVAIRRQPDASTTKNR